MSASSTTSKSWTGSVSVGEAIRFGAATEYR